MAIGAGDPIIDKAPYGFLVTWFPRHPPQSRYVYRSAAAAAAAFLRGLPVFPGGPMRHVAEHGRAGG